MNTTDRTPARPPTLAVPIAAVAAAVVNVVVLFIGQAAGASLVAGGQPVGVAQVIIATLVAFGLGAGLLWLVARKQPERARLLAWAGLVVGIASVIGPLTMAAELTTGLTLAVMHVATALAWFVAAGRRG